MPARFLFVNKDAASSSLTRSSDKEQSSINSHVQRGRRHRRSGNASSRRKVAVREKRPDSPAPSLQPECGSASSESPPNCSSHSPAPTALTKRSSYGVISFNDAPEGSVTPDPQTSNQSARGQGRRSRDGNAANRLRVAQQTADDLISFAAHSPDPKATTPPSTALVSCASPDPRDVSQLANNPIDPFRHSSITIDERTHSLLEYYRTVYHPAVWHVDAKATQRADYGFRSSATDVIEAALQSDVDMYALLACMSSRRQYIDNQYRHHETDEYLGQALAATQRFMRERAAKEPKSNEEILMVIFHLYATEGYRNNTEAARVHLRGARNIIDLLGGLKNLRDPQMRELLIIGDGHLAAMSLEPCMLPVEFDPGPYQKATPLNIQLNPTYDLRDIAPALRQSPKARHIPQPIRQLVDETAELNWVLANVDDGAPEAIKCALRWIQLRSLAIRHKLLGLYLPDQLYHAIRTALVLWILTSTTLLGKLKIRFFLAPKLRGILRSAAQQRQDWDDHADLKAWLFTMGALCCEPGCSDQAWFVRKLGLLIHGLIDSAHVDPGILYDEDLILHHLERLMDAFFYHKLAFEDDLRTLAKELVTQATHCIAETAG